MSQEALEQADSSFFAKIIPTLNNCQFKMSIWMIARFGEESAILVVLKGKESQTKTLEFVAEVYQRVEKYGVFDKAEAASQKSKDGESIEETWQLLDKEEKQ